MKQLSHYRQIQLPWLHWVLQPFPTNYKLLDLGCGEDVYDDYSNLIKRFDKTGIDRLPSADVVSDIEKPLPFENETFDIVLSLNTFEHLHDEQSTLKESHRVLKTGGWFVGSTPFLYKVHQSPYDFNRFTHFELDALLKEAGFKDIEIHPLGTRYDVFYMTALHYFQPIVNETLISRVLWQVMKLVLRFKTDEKDLGFCLGYNWIARK